MVSESTQNEDAFTDESEDEDLVEELSITADPGQELIRIDKFLVNRVERVSRNKVQNAIRAGSVKVNGKEVKPNYRIRPGDQMKVIIPRASENIALEPENIPLDILYEDESLIVINKQAGLVVHPGVGNHSGTLVNALLYHYKDLPSQGGEQARAGLVHRLDKDTSGIMVIAKSEYAMQHLARQFFQRSTKRAYQALVWGNVEEEEGRIEVHLGRHKRFFKQMDAYPEGDTGKEAITNYRVLQRFGYVTLVECRLETGRTHQIRAHMKYLGHPLFNDTLYGGDKILKGTVYSKYRQFIINCFSLCPRQHLHAMSLGFEHPETGKDHFYQSELPEDIAAVIEKWTKYTAHLNDL